MFDAIIGKKTVEEVNRFHLKMESVYEAMATRMIEILDKEARLEQRQAEIDALSVKINGQMRQLAWQLKNSSVSELENRVNREVVMLQAAIKKQQILSGIAAAVFLILPFAVIFFN